MAAGSSQSIPSPQATAFLGSQAAGALERLGALGNRVAQISIAVDFYNENYQGVLFDTADYLVYRGLGAAGAAGAIESAGGSVAAAGFLGLIYYKSGGSQGIVQG